jgi:hypothetical protein
MGEITYLVEAGVQVTSARFVVGSNMYPIAAITSVAPYSIPPKRGVPIAVVIICGFFACINLARAIVGADGALPALFVLTLFTTGAVFWARSIKATYCVMISTSGMQARALASPDGALVGRVVVALHQAVATR